MPPSSSQKFKQRELNVVEIREMCVGWMGSVLSSYPYLNRINEQFVYCGRHRHLSLFPIFSYILSKCQCRRRTRKQTSPYQPKYFFLK